MEEEGSSSDLANDQTHSINQTDTQTVRTTFTDPRMAPPPPRPTTPPPPPIDGLCRCQQSMKCQRNLKMLFFVFFSLSLSLYPSSSLGLQLRDKWRSNPCPDFGIEGVGLGLSRLLVDKRRMDLHGSDSFTTGAQRSEGARRPAIVWRHGEPPQETKIYPITSDSSRLPLKKFSQVLNPTLQAQTLPHARAHAHTHCTAGGCGEVRGLRFEHSDLVAIL